MEHKWDIYVYNSVFLFVRSWTGELRYRADAMIGPARIEIARIECPASEKELAPSHVYFLMGTHAMRRVLPHRIPRSMPRDPVAISLWSFAMFGCLGCYATYQDVTGVSLNPKRPSA